MSNENIDPIERSDDPRRGEMAHLKVAIGTVMALLKKGGPCTWCTATRASHVVNTRATPQLVCTTCAAKYEAADNIGRRRMINDFARRGA
jgi:hypothetical protein